VIFPFPKVLFSPFCNSISILLWFAQTIAFSLSLLCWQTIAAGEDNVSIGADFVIYNEASALQNEIINEKIIKNNFPNIFIAKLYNKILKNPVG
jgi:hypothetical protein